MHLLPIKNEKFVLELSPFFVCGKLHEKTAQNNSFLAINLLEHKTFGIIPYIGLFVKGFFFAF